MNIIENQEYFGERPLFKVKDVELRGIKVLDGESALKFNDNIKISNSYFNGKYPFWHCSNLIFKDNLFDTNARAAAWYIKDFAFENCTFKGPKMFRDGMNIKIANSVIEDADENFWNCQNIALAQTQIKKGSYIFLHSQNINCENVQIEANYSFQYTKDVVLKNCTIKGKDMLWETDNVTLIDCTVEGEYIAWHSRNLKMINCHIKGTQPLSYADDLVLENCTFDKDCDLAFEDSSLQATIYGYIKSIKNPRSGVIEYEDVGEIIIDEYVLSPNNCKITKRGN